MGLFGKTKKNSGWMAISCLSDGIFVAHVKRPPSGKPVVELFSFYPADKTAYPAALDKLAKELHADRYQCSHLLTSGEYQLLSMDAPNVPPDELKNAIRWSIKDMLDYHVDDATIDVLAVPLDKDGPARSNTLFAVAARNQLIGQRQALFEGAKIALCAIDIPEMAQRNISALLESEGRAIALLSFNAEGGLITITFGGELYFSRRIDMTVMQLQQADVSHKTALHERITLELQRSLDHFDRQYHAMPLSKLLLSPMGLEGAGLQEYLAANLYTPVETLHLESILDFSMAPELNNVESQQRYFMVLGAALRHEEKAL
ncbi:MAG: agglutinin biogenesis protein MshI [Glaciimonas sp.]|nr:agglutinin biogenesis protein MshI [Glaciimonas sp.]